MSTMITPPPTGALPPARLVPAPRGMNGTPCGHAELDDARRLPAADPRKDGDLRRVFFEHEGVALVDQQLGMGVEHAVRADDRAQLVDESRLIAECGHRRAADRGDRRETADYRRLGAARQRAEMGAKPQAMRADAYR